MPESRYTELFRFTSVALPPDTFHVVRFRGTEGLNCLFSFTIDLVSRDSNLDAAKVLGAAAVFDISRNNGKKTEFHGYPTRVEQGGHFNGYTWYTVELRPAFWKLTQVVQSAIFLDKTARDTTEELLNGQQFFSIPHEFRLTRPDYPTPEFAMQYGESVHDYILWRMEEQGAYFFFAPDGDKIIFADAPQSHDSSSVTVSYSPTTGLEGEKREEVLTVFTMAQTPLPRRVVVRTFDWKNPNKPVVGMADVAAEGMGDVYLTSENVESDADAARIAKIRAEELICRSRVFSGVGSVPVLRPGLVFTLERHYNTSFNRDYMVTEITHEGGQEAFLSLGLGIPLRDAVEHLFYRNSFSCIEADVPYHPARKAPRASIPGVIRAFVDGGGSGARAEMDEYGRYKLLFPFDISGRKGGNASCWIRMAQPQVGKDSGMSFPLLPGAEVTVAFLGGNPDRPVITGALPNAETGAITGSGNVNFSGIRTPGGNQITINDTDTHQGISLQTASGLGLTMSAGSLGATTQHQNVGLDITSIVGSEIASLGKSLITGCKTSTAASLDIYATVMAATTAVQNALSGVLDSLATKATKSDHKIAGEVLRWGSDGTKTVCMLINTLVDAYDVWHTPDSHYGAVLKGSASQATCKLQIWPSMKRMLPLLLTWLVGDTVKYAAETADSILEYKNPEKPSTNKKDDSYGTYPKLDTVRRAMVSAIGDILPELTAILLQFKAMSGLGKQHGGISLSSPDKNINLDAHKTISLHSDVGVFLNTHRDGESGTWGVKSTKNYDIGSKKANTLKPFVAVTTTNRYVAAKKSEESYEESLVESGYHKMAHTDHDDYVCVTKDSVQLRAKYIMVESNSGQKASVMILPDNIALFADSGRRTGISIHKGKKVLALHNEGAVLGLDKDGIVAVKSNGGAKLAMDGDIVIRPAEGKSVFCDQVCVKGTELKAAGQGGILKLGGQVKITGESAGKPKDISLNDLSAALDAQKANIAEDKAAVEAHEDAAKGKAEGSVAAAKGDLAIKEGAVMAKDAVVG